MNKSVLHLSYRNFENIPTDLLEYDEFLEEVYLKENFISSIPDWLLQLTNLRFIHLAGNSIKCLPVDIYYLENLEFFDVSDNQLELIPTTFGKLQNLKRFSISGNKLKSLPKTIGDLKKLQILDVSANLLQHLPLELSLCTEISELILNDNIHLQRIPERITNLANLETLCAERCGLIYLPGILSPTVKHLRIFQNNFITFIPWAYEKFLTSYFWVHSLNFQRPPIQREHPRIHLVDFPESVIFLPLLTKRCYQQTKTDPKRNAFTLFDLCLNANHKKSIHHCEDNDIPLGLREYINNGPLAKCSNESCPNYIFSEYYLSIGKRLNSTSNIIVAGYFCSFECSEDWLKCNKSKYYVINWVKI